MTDTASLNGARPRVRVLAFEALWGLAGSLADCFRGIRERGYDGVEAGVPSILTRLDVITEAEAADFASLLDDHGLDYLPMVFTVGPERGSRRTHAESLEHQLDEAMGYAPRQITAHTGADSMTIGEAVELFEVALALEREVGVPIGHETHRGRILHSPFMWRDVHERVPELRTVADLSHWVTVCERLPEDIDQLVATCCAAAVHVHARVGQPEAPQVSDPRRPEWAAAVAWHERWWRHAFEARIAGGDTVITFDPEYGPPPYLPTVPATGAPVADLAELRAWTTARVRHIAADAVASASAEIHR